VGPVRRKVYPVIAARDLSAGDLVCRVCNRHGEPDGPQLNYTVRGLRYFAQDGNQFVTIQHGMQDWEAMTINTDTLVQLEISP